MPIDNKSIEMAKEILGEKALQIMIDEIPLEWDGKSAKSIFRDEKTASMKWHKEKNRLKDFGSGNTMDFVDFAIKYRKLSFHDAVKQLFDMVGFDYNDSDFKESVNSNHFSKHYQYPKDEPDNDRSIVNSYMKKRMISEDTLNSFGVKEDANGNIAFKFFDTNSEHVCTKYRVSRPYNKEKEKSPKWWWQKGAGMCQILYGVQRIDTTKPLLIVEGLPDALACVEAGYNNTVSIPSGAKDTNWISFNWDFIEKFSTIILWFDDDVAGQEGLSECIEKLGISRTKIVKNIEYLKDDILEKSDGKVSKLDANNILVFCGKEALLKCINDSEYLPNPKLKSLFSYDEVEIADLSYISTGFKSLDKVVTGNFEGNFIVITGFSGRGKSTLIATMGMISPIEAGKKVMIFSGEANGGLLLGSIFRPLAGRNHIIVNNNTSRGVPNTYRATIEAKRAIREYYSSNIMYYDDKEEIKTTASGILKEMDYAYNRYGVRVFTLDNLMCISCSENVDNKYSSQIDFAMDLKKFTRKNKDAIVILVAHPKKPSAGQSDVGMYDVAGASEIPNLADRSYSINKIDPEKNEGFNSRISILKDRQTGYSDRHISMYYDIVTNRIYSDMDELNKNYSWEKSSSNIYYPKDIREKIVANQKGNDEYESILGSII